MSIGGTIQSLIDKIDGTERSRKRFASAWSIIKQIEQLITEHESKGGRVDPQLKERFGKISDRYYQLYQKTIPQGSMDMVTGAARQPGQQPIQQPGQKPEPPPISKMERVLLNAADRSNKLYAPVDERDVELAGPNPMYEYLRQSQQETQERIPPAHTVGEHVADFAGRTIPDLPLMIGAGKVGTAAVEGLNIGKAGKVMNAARTAAAKPISNALVAPGKAGASPMAQRALVDILKKEAARDQALQAVGQLTKGQLLKGQLAGASVGGAIFNQAEQYQDVKDRALGTLEGAITWPLMHLGFEGAKIPLKKAAKLLKDWDAKTGFTKAQRDKFQRFIYEAREYVKEKTGNRPFTKEQEEWLNTFKDIEDIIGGEIPGASHTQKRLMPHEQPPAEKKWGPPKAAQAQPPARKLTPDRATAETELDNALNTWEKEDDLAGRKKAITDELDRRDKVAADEAAYEKNMLQSPQGANMLRGDLQMDDWSSNYRVPKDKNVIPYRDEQRVPQVFGTGNRALNKRIQEALRRAQIRKKGGGGGVFPSETTATVQPQSAEKTKQPAPKKEKQLNLIQWVQKSGRGNRKEAEELFGITKEADRKLWLQLTSDDGLGWDDLAQSAINEGVLPQNPSNVTPTQWLMDNIRGVKPEFNPKREEKKIAASAKDYYEDLHEKARQQFGDFEPTTPSKEPAGNLPEGAVVSTRGDVFRVEGQEPEGTKLKDGTEITVDPWDEVEVVGKGGPREKPKPRTNISQVDWTDEEISALGRDAFQKAYQYAFKQSMKYSPGEAGSKVWTDHMARLYDAHPDWAEEAENIDKPAESPAKQEEKHSFSEGDEVEYKGEKWQIGFISPGGVCRLQKSGDPGAKQVTVDSVMLKPWKDSGENEVDALYEQLREMFDSYSGKEKDFLQDYYFWLAGGKAGRQPIPVGMAMSRTKELIDIIEEWHTKITNAKKGALQASGKAPSTTRTESTEAGDQIPSPNRTITSYEEAKSYARKYGYTIEFDIETDKNGDRIAKFGNDKGETINVTIYRPDKNRIEKTGAGDQITPTELRPQAEIPKGKIGKTSEPIEGRGGVGMFGKEEPKPDQADMFEAGNKPANPSEKPFELKDLTKSRGAIIPKKNTKQQALAQKLYDMIIEYDKNSHFPVNNRLLNELAEEIYGVSKASGEFDSSDVYEALEIAVNKVMTVFGKQIYAMEPGRALDYIWDNIVTLLPTQNLRTAEKDSFQQFSTPPSISLAVAHAAQPGPGDVFLEPSAGTGSLVAIPKAMGATIHANELDPKRAEMLRWLGHETTEHNAEFINDLLPQNIKPNKIVMNPPFSSTAGRLDKNDTKFGFRHVESALQRLADNGRLVAVLGESALLDRVKSAQWWEKIAEKYNVRGMFAVPGKEYKKYGTEFGTVIVIIDKTGPTPGNTWAERLKNIVRTDHPQLEDTINEIRKIKIERESKGEMGVSPSDVRGSGGKPASKDQRGGGIPRPGERGERIEPAGPAGSAKGPEAIPESASKPAKQPAERGPVQPRGDATSDAGGVNQAGVKFETQQDVANKRQTESGGKYVQYKPAKLKGGKPHKSKIVESAAMAAVDPPNITYTPKLPKELIESGDLSDLQLEFVCYAGMQHQIVLPNGRRAGAFNGDGTGVGKGRTNAAIILDNYNQGRKRSLWLSVSKDLHEDAKRDLNGVQAGHIPTVLLNDFGISDKIDIPEGVIFATYSTLISTKAGAEKASRLQQIVDWLGDDGVIIFDESHKAKNALEQVGGKPSQTGQAVLDLQEVHLPLSYVTYSSATGATDVRNMAYMTRLGLWGDGTSFDDFQKFMYSIDGGGLGAMEVVARDMKALGKYCSRSLSFEGVEYRETTHELTVDQKKTYDVACLAWQSVLQDVDAAIATTGANTKARAWAMQRFYNDQQRFFKQMIMSFKIPTLLRRVEEEIENGNSVVIGLIGTGEAQTVKRISEAMSEGEDIDDLDFTPRDIIANYIEKSFPTTQYIETQDIATGKIVSTPMKDNNGNVVESREAVEMKEKLLDQISDMNFPDNPLDQIVNHFRPEKVAELTGRKKRLIRNPHTKKMEYVKRAPEGVAMKKVNVHEMAQFQSGKKRIAIISDAASTGISLHSDLGAKNQQKRVHITLELSWSADKLLQGLGRTHRNNQRVAPEYDLLSTNIGGEKRFSSTAGKRLAHVGALTKGQSDAAGGGDIAKYNYETKYGAAALRLTYQHMLDEFDIPGVENPKDLLRRMGILKQSGDRESIKENDMVDVPRFLNRLLAVEVDTQNALFDYFDANFRHIIQMEKETGNFDDGVTDIKGASNVVLKGRKNIYRDKQTGAETEVITLNADFKTSPVSFPKAKEFAMKAEGRFVENRRSKNYAVAYKIGSRTDAQTGRVVEQFKVVRYTGNTEIYDVGDMYSDFVTATPDAAEKWWNEHYNDYPKEKTEEINLVSGLLLPFWQKIMSAVGDSKASKLKVVRINTDKGERFIGVQIPNNRVDPVLRAIGINRKISDPEQVFNAVFDQRTQIPIEGGMKLVPSRYSWEDVIEIMGVESDRYNFFRDLGVINERKDWKQRFYIPNDKEKAVGILKKILAKFPTMGDDLGAALGINPLGLLLGFQQDNNGNWTYDVALGTAGAVASIFISRAVYKLIKGAIKKSLIADLHEQAKRLGKNAFQEVLFNNGIKNGKIPYGRVREIVNAAKKTKVKPSGPVGRIIEVLKEAKPIRGQQERVYTQERGRRMGQAEAARQNYQGEASYRVKLSKLAGEMHKVDFESIRGKISQGDIDELFNMIENYEPFDFWTKLSTQNGLMRLLGAHGAKVPTERELVLLNKVFGTEFVKVLLSKRSLWQKAKDVGLEIANVPRSLMASFDLSAPFRQGIIMTSRPKQFFGAFHDMVKSYGSERVYQEVMHNIEMRPTYKLMRAAKLEITDLEAVMAVREEAYMSNFAEKIPVIGRGIRASGRAYSAFLNKLRADVFDDLVKKARVLKLHPDENIDLAKSIASFINNATGRGSLGRLEGAAKALNAFFFSPRLLSSRIRMLRPDFYAKLDPFARKEALKSMLAFTGAVTTVLALAKLAGADVTGDARSADFGKIKIGNTRIDVTGGFGQYIRIATQLTTGELKSTRTGNVINIGVGNNKLSRYDIATRFIENKEAPIFSFATDLMRGKPKYEKKLSIPKEVLDRVTPMVIMDAVDLYRDDPSLMPLTALGVLGFGLQTYK